MNENIFKKIFVRKKHFKGPIHLTGRGSEKYKLFPKLKPIDFKNHLN